MIKGAALSVAFLAILTADASAFSIRLPDGASVTIVPGRPVELVWPGFPNPEKDLEEALALTRQVDDLIAKRSIRNAIELVRNTDRETQKAVENIFNTADKAMRDTASTLVKAVDDAAEAVAAISRYAEREIQGIGTSLSDSQQRFREGKVVDAIWHLGTDPANQTQDNAATLAQENRWVATAMQAAATAYGGPAGSAAFAAWLAYHQSDGNFEVAVRVGLTAYATQSGYASVDAMPTGTMGGLLRKSAVAGTVGGLAVAASGGSNEESIDAFVKSGGAVLVQAGQAYVNEQYVDPARAEASSYLDRAKAQADAFCMTSVDRSCADALDWVEGVQDDLEAAKASGGAKPTLVTSGDGDWAVSWNQRQIASASTGVPSVVLSYVGEGSAVRDRLKQISSLTQEQLIKERWVALENVGTRRIFFRHVDGRYLDEVDAGDVLVAATDINIRTRPAGWDSFDGILPKDSVVTVLNVDMAPAGEHSLRWMRVHPIALTEQSAAWIYLGRIFRTGSWEQPRSADLLGSIPEQITGRAITLDRAVNVRNGPFVFEGRNPNGSCAFSESDIIGSLAAGRDVVLERVMRFPECDTYIWAQVRVGSAR